MKKLKKVALLLMACYCIAYIMVATHEGYSMKNEYEQQKIESYKEASQ